MTDIDIIALAKKQACTSQRQLPNGRKVYNTHAQLQEATRTAFKPPAKKPQPVKKQQVINPRIKSNDISDDNVEELDVQLEAGETEDERLQAHMERARQIQRSNKLSDKRIPGAFAELVNQKRVPPKVDQPVSSNKSKSTQETRVANIPQKQHKKPVEDDIDINDLDDLQIDNDLPEKSSKSDKSTKLAKSKSKKEKKQKNVPEEIEEESISDIDDDIEDDNIAVKKDSGKKATSK
jgi:hypothetical protein